jgi:hypothetical protein
VGAGLDGSRAGAIAQCTARADRGLVGSPKLNQHLCLKHRFERKEKIGNADLGNADLGRADLGPGHRRWAIVGECCSLAFSATSLLMDLAGSMMLTA